MQRLVWATAAPPLTVRKAHSAAELRAAGCLRAAAFTVLPPDRSEFARQSFLRMKTDAAWQALEGKVAGTDTDYKDCTVTPLIALLPADTCPAGAEPACMLPAEVGVRCLCSRKITSGLNAANVANAAYPVFPNPVMPLIPLPSARLPACSLAAAAGRSWSWAPLTSTRAPSCQLRSW